MTYAFTFDARYCSGCKACQAACKDKNNLPGGVLWRRVYEVSGGSWQQNGHTWTNDVFAYNLSISCNHCLHPKCAGVCPTNAYVLREDGIVFLDSSKCVGCGYCAWACPYAAPQYNAQAGHMSKCDFCYDNLEQGLPPACVAACPMRTLNYGDMEEPINGTPLWDTPSSSHPYPLPAFSRTQPRLAITPHPAMNVQKEKSIGNLEEIRPHPRSNWDELPLMLFTLLTQLAVSGFWVMTLVFPLMWSSMEQGAIGLRLLPLLLVGASLGAGMLASFAHLGTKKNAWRVLQNVRKSSLSKEILFTGLFGLGWFCTALAEIVWRDTSTEWSAATSILGIGLIYNMSQVYRFPAAQSWNTWRTNVSFMLSTFLLGITSMAPLLVYEASLTNIEIPTILWRMIGTATAIFLATQLAIIQKSSWQPSLHLTRKGLLVAGITVSLAIGMFNLQGHWLSIFIFLIVAMEEIIGRWLFYEAQPSIVRRQV